MNNKKIEQGTVIKFLVTLSEKVSVIFTELTTVYAEDCLLQACVYKWAH